MFTHSDLYTHNNIFKYKELFHTEPPYNGPLTLRKENHDGKISLYKLYLSFAVEDPTEIVFSEEVFGEHAWWLRACETFLLKPHLEEWRMIAAEKRKQIAFKAIMDEVKTSAKAGKSAFAAAKYLIEEPWKNGKSVADKKRIKKQIMETADAAFQSKEIQSDYNRLKEQGILN